MSEKYSLNPGVPARKRSSLCKFSLWIGLILGALFLFRLAVTIGKSLFWFTHFSHSHILQNQTLDQVQDRASVVRPLIDENQVFDIAVSIWTMPAEMHDGERIPGDVAETPLYSDIVFRGLRLSDKHIYTTLSYKLPTALFRRLLLKGNDLRASFVVIPTTPSLVEYVTNISTWRPETMRIPPVRAWPFPLGTFNTASPTMVDKALDSFGISIPLMEFHEIASKCGGSKVFKPKFDDDEAKGADEGDEDDEDDFNPVTADDEANWRFSAVSDIARNPLHAVNRHPFIVTRTQIRIVDEVRIFNRKAFNKEHNKLKSTSCGQGRDMVVDPNLCYGSFYSNGNWETRFKLQIPDEETGKFRTEWAYGPYMGHGVFSAGPKDLVPVPVTRETCPELKNAASSDPEYIDINWRLSYSGRSPAKFGTSEIISHPTRVGYNDSEYKKIQAHDRAELWNGLYGHRFYEDAHPRRRLILAILSGVLFFVQSVLELGYWYTRTSTAFISVPGTIMIAASGIIAALAHVASSAETQKLNLSASQWFPWLWLILLTLVTRFSLPLLMLKTATRLEFAGSNGRTFHLVPPTHKERNSQRLDSRTSWAVKTGVCVFLLVIYYFSSPDEYHVLAGQLPPPGPDDHPTNIVNRFSALLISPLLFTGRLSQFLLNHRAKTFAGSYKIAVVLRVTITVLWLMRYSPALVGRFDALPGLSAPQAVDTIVLAGIAWQALVFPKAVQRLEDEDSE
ncbi:hypothetical protein C8F04DRAFT_1140897 [Mycena alexandri]|uniref:Uncharacterized protein n=1 Tax=Mycena alexandri TaxID=1745969 RepID=A0AAD6S968_9AGAR|nr:hypothetical protein C8F04DRAFT_1140897 [Mycena alexandri]